jgi:outer membrane autotransporter protein
MKKLKKVNKTIIPTAISLFAIVNQSSSYAFDYSGTGVLNTSQSTTLYYDQTTNNYVWTGPNIDSQTYRNLYNNLSPINPPAGFASVSTLSTFTSNYNTYTVSIIGTGAYSFGVSDPAHPANYVLSTGGHPMDLMSALYVHTGAAAPFNPASYSTNIVAVSDDISNTPASNPYPLFYINSSAGCVTMTLVYFSYNGSVGNVNINASGPGHIATSCAALSAYSNGFSADRLTNGAALALGNLGGGTGAMANVITQLNTLSASQQTSALEKLIPITNRSLQLTSRNNMLSAFDRISLRLDSFRGRLGMASGDYPQENGFWFKPFGGGMAQTGKDGYSGYNGSNWGLSGGFDHNYADGTVAGLAFTYTKANLNYSDQQTGDANSINSYQISAYGSKPVGDGYVETMVAYARQNYASNRNTGISGTAIGNFDGDSWGVRLGGGIPYTLTDSTVLTPIARLDWNHISQYAYGENGAGALNLNVGNVNADRLRSSLGVQVNQDLELFGIKTQPYLRTFWHYDFLNSGVNTTSSFSGGGTTFITPGQSLDHNTGTVGTGIKVFTEDNFTASVGYDVNLGSGYQSHTAQATARWEF